ncbi:glycosyl transferase family protein [Novosphingobium resinovorum]|uniref:glycosyl transferase family protein n=1 Tax=Novosphingobium resinovorum TaxID=158500 RepID=UPI002ED520E2|nr:glycosyl transferase family protein [Novosphingobium resinovorum]
MQASTALTGIVACLQGLEHELLLFVGFWFVIGALDEFAIDACWIVLRLTGRARDGFIGDADAQAPLSGRAAVMIAAWSEAEVIGPTVRHALAAWRQQDFTLYLGCYGNDPATVEAAVEAAGSDGRVRLVIGEMAGPTTKADCLNRIYEALCADEQRQGRRYRSVIIHDAEDMVHPAALAVMDAGLARADFVQLPVLPELQPQSPWVAAHYADEFVESHGKAMVVRDALGAAIPAAGVGCGFSRGMIARIARRRGDEGAHGGPFAAECLTEDYELGLLVRREGGRSRFLRVRDEAGRLVATRAYFPARLSDAVRQKSRWVHGIAFQGWDRLGWTRGFADTWMALRDRRGPLTAVVLACGYALLAIEALLWILAGQERSVVPDGLRVLLAICLAGFVWRAAMRFVFTAREYGVIEGLGAIARILTGNLVAILAGRRALAGYLKVLRGGGVHWEKTLHHGHPALPDHRQADPQEALAA